MFTYVFTPVRNYSDVLNAKRNSEGLNILGFTSSPPTTLGRSCTTRPPAAGTPSTGGTARRSQASGGLEAVSMRKLIYYRILLLRRLSVKSAQGQAVFPGVIDH